MSETQQQVVTHIDPVERAYQELLVFYNEVRKDQERFAVEFYKRWQSFTKQQRIELVKDKFRFDSYSRGEQIALVGKRYAEKKQLIINELTDHSRLCYLPSSIESMYEVALYPDQQLKKVTRKGLFDRIQPSHRDIRTARTTGKIPRLLGAEKRTPASGPTERLQRKFESAERHMIAATGDIMQIVEFMEKHKIRSVRGLEVKGFRRAFVELCAAMASADPKKYDKAIEILGGE